MLCFILALIAGLEASARTLPLNSRKRYLTVQELESKVVSLVLATETSSLEKRSPQTGNQPAGAQKSAFLGLTETRLLAGIPTDSATNTAAFVAVLRTSSSSSTTFETPTPSATMNPGAYVDGTRTTSAQPSGTNPYAYVDVAKTNKHPVILSWPTWKIFVGNYLPVLLAVLLRMFWTPIMANARLMQPFLAMARPEGAPARSVLFMGYLSRNINPISMMVEGSWLTLGTMINLAVITLMAPISSEAIFLDTRYDCENPDLTSNNPCWPPRISMDRYIIRILQGLLAVAALISICIIFGVARSLSPTVQTDPSSIAGVAVLAHHPVLLQDLKAECPNASMRELRESLPNRHYSLQQYLASDGRWKYGIAPVIGADYGPISETTGYNHGPRPSHLNSPRALSRDRSKIWDTVVHGTSAALTLGLLGLIVAYYFDSSDDPFNRFFNSDTFGPRFIMTGLATIASSGFGSLQQGIYPYTTNFGFL